MMIIMEEKIYGLLLHFCVASIQIITGIILIGITQLELSLKVNLIYLKIF